MYSKAKINGHPIHPTLVAFPIALYTLTVIAFLVYQFADSNPFWYRLAFFSNIAGVGSAVLAAIPGTIDWAFGIPKATAAKRRGALHMVLNVSALVLFAISAWRIWGTWDSPNASVGFSLIFSVIGLGLTFVAGYHGWELISTHKVGVDLTQEQERLEVIEETQHRGHEGTQQPRPV